MAKREPRVPVSVRFPVPLYEELKRQADLRGVSVNWLVVRAIEEYLDRHYPNREAIVAEWRVRHAGGDTSETLPIRSQADIDKIVESLYDLLTELRCDDA